MWRPQIGFYEQRVALLQTLDDAGGLRRFRMPDNRVEAQIADVGVISLGPGQLRLEVGSPVYDDLALRRTVEACLVPFKDTASTWRTRCCFVVPTPGTYDAMRKRAIASWTTTPLSEESVDVAILVDGRDRATGDEYQSEFGVIRADEAPDRLRGTVSRAAGPLAIAEAEVETGGLPEVATFLDWTWEARFDERSLSDAGLTAWERALTQTSVHSDAIHNLYVPSPTVSNIDDPRRGSQ